MNTIKPTLGIGILSWQSPKTLRISLESFEKEGFLSNFDEKMIFFSDISDEDIALAKEFGWEYSGGPNQGISGGMRRLGENMKSDYIILLQNDNQLIEGVDFATKHIQDGLKMLHEGKVDLVRMRHRWKVGEFCGDVTRYLRYYPAIEPSDEIVLESHSDKPLDYKDNWRKKLLRFFRPFKVFTLRGRSLFLEKHPDKVYPKQIKRHGDFYILDSRVLDFSDQCIFLSRDFWLNTLMAYADAHPSRKSRPNGFQAPEICINGMWWRSKRYKIAQGRGVFTTYRLDGAYYAHHPSLQGEVKLPEELIIEK
jgi:hypothetical protein